MNYFVCAEIEVRVSVDLPNSAGKKNVIKSDWKKKIFQTEQFGQLSVIHLGQFKKKKALSKTLSQT